MHKRKGEWFCCGHIWRVTLCYSLPYALKRIIMRRDANSSTSCHVNRAKEHIAQLTNGFKLAVCLTTLLKHSNQQYQQIFQKTN
jgi:hypothetical protein